MRLAAVALTFLVLTTPAFAQPSACSPQAAGWTFDPYKPSDLVIARNFAGTVLAQAPIGALLELDPYVPFEGELLRQLGRATPAWAYAAYAWYPPAPRRSRCVAVRAAVAAREPSVTPPLTTLNDALAVLTPRAPGATAGSTAPASSRIRGITIEWAGRTWVSAGPAVAFREAEFVRAGERAQSPVFQRAGAKDSVIYIRTTPGMVAPFRASP